MRGTADTTTFGRVFRVEPRPVCLRNTTRAIVPTALSTTPGSLRPLTRHVHVWRNRTSTASDCAAGVESRRFVNVYDARPSAVGDRRRRRHRRRHRRRDRVLGGREDLVPLTGTAVVRRAKCRLGQTAPGPCKTSACFRAEKRVPPRGGFAESLRVGLPVFGCTYRGDHV